MNSTFLLKKTFLFVIIRYSCVISSVSCFVDLEMIIFYLLYRLELTVQKFRTIFDQATLFTTVKESGSFL